LRRLLAAGRAFSSVRIAQEPNSSAQKRARSAQLRNHDAQQQRLQIPK
jgi:hypothetical protein